VRAAIGRERGGHVASLRCDWRRPDGSSDPENGFCGGRYDTGCTPRKGNPVVLCKVIGTS
jgi:hypothetical protein